VTSNNVHALCAIIDTRWDFDDPAGTERVFRDWLEAESDPAARVLLRTQIARTLGLQRRFDEAHALLDELEADLDEAGPLGRVRWLLERGRTLNSSGRKDEARPLFAEAWDVARAIGADFYAVDAAHMIAIVAPPGEAQMFNERALAAARASADPRARDWEGSLCNNLGWTCHAQGDYQTAMRHFEHALAARRRQGKPGPIRIARWCVGRCQRSLGRLNEALAIQQFLLAEHEAAGSSDGFVHEELGECLLALGRADEARPHLRRAHELLSADPWLAEAEPRRLARLANLAGRS